MADERRHYLPPSAAVPSAESASSASSNRWAAAPSDVTVGAADRVPLAGAFAPATSPPLTPPTDYVGARPLSAPPDLGVSAAFGMQPLWFTVRDIRADEDYESFYNEFKGNAKLPPPLDPSILRGEFEAFAADVTRRERSGRATAEAFPALMHDTAEPVDATTLSGASTANPQNLVRPRPLPFAATLLRRNDSDASVENLIFRESLKLASQLDREGSDGDLAGSAERRSSDAVGSQVDAGVWQSPPASLLASPPVQLSTISPRPAPTPPVASTNAVAVMPTVTSMPAGVGAPTAPWDHQDVGEVARHGYRRAELEPSSVPYSRGYLRYNGHGGYSAVTPSPAFAAPTAATAAAPYAMPRGGLATSPPVSRHPSRFQQQRHLQGPPVPSAPHAYTLQPGASASGAPRPPLEVSAAGNNSNSGGGGGGGGGALDAGGLNAIAISADQIVALARDQHGGRFLQAKIEQGRREDIDRIFHQCLPHYVELMQDPFGNYLCQKLFEHCTDEQKLQLLQQSAAYLATVSMNAHGTRAVQRMVECASSPEQTQVLCNALAPYCVSLMCDVNGNHVVQRCLQRLDTPRKQFLYDEAVAHCHQLATHRHGCCVLQRCLDHATPAQRARLCAAIVSRALELIQDPFGNYVIQYVLNLNEAPYTHAVVEQIRGHLLELSTQKFSSNVVEKVLQQAQVDHRRLLIRELIYGAEGTAAAATPHSVRLLLFDPYGNYVIQRALQLAIAPELEALCESIQPHLPELKNTPFGKRIQARIAKQLPRSSRHTLGGGGTTSAATGSDGAAASTPRLSHERRFAA
ncbi:hypothetical protein CDCA_CDCA10G3071 [Cyanidium caldarium]|uniref:PUM-HD domain-containing protein n=1 Tax=Cyanidium caldarium TaxID=2771 RepID=A0AAV9IY41_CYACA|nr:hypothetical protein CDCA_CDCA10G3071 [Cyanidium caldarium]